MTDKGDFFYIEDEDGYYLGLSNRDNPWDSEQLMGEVSLVLVYSFDQTESL